MLCEALVAAACWWLDWSEDLLRYWAGETVD